MRESLFTTFPASVVAASFLTVVCCCWTVGAKGDERVPREQKRIVILEKPVSVSMEMVSGDYPDFEQEVRYGHTVFSLRTFIIGVRSLRNAISIQRKHTGG
jgi:hypothetical protein